MFFDLESVSGMVLNTLMGKARQHLEEPVNMKCFYYQVNVIESPLKGRCKWPVSLS